MQDWYEQRLEELEDRTQDLEKLCGTLAVRLQKSEEQTQAAMDALRRVEEDNASLHRALRDVQMQMDAVSDDMEDVVVDINTLFETLEGHPHIEEDEPTRNRQPIYDAFEDYDDDDDWDDEDDEEDDEVDQPPTGGLRRFIRFFPK